MLRRGFSAGMAARIRSASGIKGPGVSRLEPGELFCAVSSASSRRSRNIARRVSYRISSQVRSSNNSSCARMARTAFGKNARPASVNCVRPTCRGSRGQEVSSNFLPTDFSTARTCCVTLWRVIPSRWAALALLLSSAIAKKERRCLMFILRFLFGIVAELAL